MSKQGYERARRGNKQVSIDDSANGEAVKEAVRAQFGRTAAAYASSAVHARGEDLNRLVTMLTLHRDERVLDVGTATGHTALRVAPHVAHVTGVDMTAAMLAMARTLAAERGITNVSFEEGDAEHLPYANGSFDVVTCRVCAHHFPHVQRAVDEMARVLRAGGRVGMVDNYAPEDAGLDTFINKLEVVRDPTHVREYTLGEWRQFFEHAGLVVLAEDLGEMQLDVADWVARAQTAAENVAQVHEMLGSASQAARDEFSIVLGSRPSFKLKRMILLGERPGR